MKINFLKKFNQNQKMPKRNLIFLMLLISVLMVSVVSAGITGYTVELRRGIAVSDDNLGRTSVQSVSGDTATFHFTDPNTGVTEILSGTEGQTVTTSSGTQVEITKVTEGSLFKRGAVEIDVEPIPTKFKTPNTLSSQNQTNVTCKVCTEKYKVLEGEVQVVQGNDIGINYIDADSTALSVNGAITSDLSEGQTFQLDYGEIVIINDVYGIPQGIGEVELCLSGCYKVLEGEVQIVKGDSISIDYIDVDSTALSVNGAITSDLLEGQTFKLTNGQIVTIKDVYHPGFGGQIGEVEFCLSSSN